MHKIAIELFVTNDSEAFAFIQEYALSLTLFNRVLSQVSFMLENFNKNLAKYVGKVPKEVLALRFLEKNDLYGKDSNIVPAKTKGTIALLDKMGVTEMYELEDEGEPDRGFIYLDPKEYRKMRESTDLEPSISIFLETRNIVTFGLGKHLDIEKYEKEYSCKYNISNFVQTDINFSRIEFNELMDAEEISRNTGGWININNLDEVFCPIPIGFR